VNGSRFPRSVFGHGHEPDPRFSLANERTFLAWLRTGLAFFAAAFALLAVQVPERIGLRLAAATVFTLLGILASVQAWANWAATERALRRSEPLPGLLAGPLMTCGTIVGAVLAVAGTLI